MRLYARWNVVLPLHGVPVTPSRRVRTLLLACVAAAALLGACSSTGTSGDAATGDGGVTCGDASCATGQVCVRTQTMGGAQNCPGDGGSCPGGYELAGACCVMIPGWSCVARPGACGASVTCACAMGTLCTSGHTCSMPRDNEIDCTLLAP